MSSSSSSWSSSLSLHKLVSWRLDSSGIIFWLRHAADPDAFAKIFAKFFEVFAKFLRTTSNQIFKNDRLWRCDQFYQKIVQIGAILAIFRPFEVFRVPKKSDFCKTLNGRLPPEDGSVRPQTLGKSVSGDPRLFVFRRRKTNCGNNFRQKISSEKKN